mgnify:FL=1
MYFVLHDLPFAIGPLLILEAFSVGGSVRDKISRQGEVNLITFYLLKRFKNTIP